MDMRRIIVGDIGITNVTASAKVYNLET